MSSVKDSVSLQRRWFDPSGLYLQGLYGQPVISLFTPIHVPKYSENMN